MRSRSRSRRCPSHSQIHDRKGSDSDRRDYVEAWATTEDSRSQCKRHDKKDNDGDGQDDVEAFAMIEHSCSQYSRRDHKSEGNDGDGRDHVQAYVTTEDTRRSRIVEFRENELLILCEEEDKGKAKDDDDQQKDRDPEKDEVLSKLCQAGDWVEPGALSSLSCLMQMRSSNSPPLSLCSELIAPFLRFEKPLPNMLYVIGGRNEIHGPLNVVEMLDTWHGRWVQCPPMSSRRSGCAAAPLPDGRVVVVGGYDERGIVQGLLKSCEVFDPVSQQWSHFTSLLRARWGHGCATLHDKVYAVGGCSLRDGAPVAEMYMETLASCEVYDCNLDKWAPCAELRVARASVRAVVIGNKYVAAVGGCKSVFGDAEALPTVELLDTEQNFWVELETKLSVPRTIAAIAAVDSHRILVFGGVSRIGENSSELSSSEIYCVKPPCSSATSTVEDDASTSREMTDVQQSRQGCQALALNLPSHRDILCGRGFPLSYSPHVVIIGGEREKPQEALEEQWEQLDSLLCYDINQGTWLPESQLPVPAMPTKRTASALCNSVGKVCALPGKRARLG